MVALCSFLRLDVMDLHLALLLLSPIRALTSQHGLHTFLKIPSPAHPPKIKTSCPSAIISPYSPEYGIISLFGGPLLLRAICMIPCFLTAIMLSLGEILCCPSSMVYLYECALGTFIWAKFHLKAVTVRFHEYQLFSQFFVVQYEERNSSMHILCMYFIIHECGTPSKAFL